MDNQKLNEYQERLARILEGYVFKPIDHQTRVQLKVDIINMTESMFGPLNGEYPIITVDKQLKFSLRADVMIKMPGDIEYVHIPMTVSPTLESFDA